MKAVRAVPNPDYVPVLLTLETPIEAIVFKAVSSQYFSTTLSLEVSKQFPGITPAEVTLVLHTLYDKLEELGIVATYRKA